MLTQEQINEAVEELHTLFDMLRWTVSRFNDNRIYFGHGTGNAWDEALALILYVLNLEFDSNKELKQARLTRSERQRIVELVESRINSRKPLSYLTNQAWFCGLPFYVDERVLVPRSPIGELIEKQFSPWLEINKVHRVLDMCTGSGCIGIACAYAFPDAEVDVSDISEDAINVAETNIEQHGLQQQVVPIQSDLFSALAGHKYDLIVTNPPYVDREDLSEMPEEFHHEPEIGLAAGDDGLDLVRHILAKASEHLTDDGVLVCEVGNSQVHMAVLYPDIPLTWLSFERGGDGVFLITKSELDQYQQQIQEAI